jgi:hypothetical protein
MQQKIVCQQFETEVHAFIIWLRQTAEALE